MRPLAACGFPTKVGGKRMEKRLRELFFCQRARGTSQVESVLHRRFYQAQSMKKGTDMRAVPVEGTLSKRDKSS